MIQVETFDFLKKLAKNNNRDWFIEHKAEYEKARENVIDFAAKVIALIAKDDKRVNPDIDPKKSVMRIYRDIRFSKDKTPYKTNFGINIKTGPGKSEMGYYLHVQPEKSFAGGGYWMPPADHLKAIRQEIDYNGAVLNKVVSDTSFIDTFSEFDKQEQLKNNPKGYEADHPYINLLKLKSFASIHQLSDKEMIDKNAAQHAVKYLKMITPINDFLFQAIQ